MPLIVLPSACFFHAHTGPSKRGNDALTGQARMATFRRTVYRHPSHEGYQLGISAGHRFVGALLQTRHSNDHSLPAPGILRNPSPMPPALWGVHALRPSCPAGSTRSISVRTRPHLQCSAKCQSCRKVASHLHAENERARPAADPHRSLYSSAHLATEAGSDSPALASGAIRPRLGSLSAAVGDEFTDQITEAIFQPASVRTRCHDSLP